MLLHIGCGDRRLPGFLNVDLYGSPDVQLDVRAGMPYRDGSVDAIFCEHFIEHLSREEAAGFLLECFRVLAPGGVLRVATPDLSALVQSYAKDDWRDAEWVERFGYGWLPNGSTMLNLAMREWGHKYLYDEDDLRMAGRLAGFLITRTCQVGVSQVSALSGLEHRDDSVVLEFEKEGDTNAALLPLVSVLIPAYNDTFFLESLDSALSQTYPNLEIIVCNDNPGNGVVQIVSHHEARGRIRLSDNQGNMGSVENYKKCFGLARGCYVKFLNDDDLLAPDCVKAMVACMEAYGESVTLVTSRRTRIDASGKPIKDNDSTRPLVAADSLIHGRDLGDFLLRQKINVVGEPTTVMFRRSDLANNRQGLFALNGTPYRMNVDVAMWLTLLSCGNAIYLADAKSSFRKHGAQEQADPQNLYSLVSAWAGFRRDGQGAGFLRDQTRLAQTLDSEIALLEAHASNPCLSQDDGTSLRELCRKARDEREVLAGAGHQTEHPSLTEELAHIYAGPDWQGPLRHVYLPGRVGKPLGRPKGFGASLVRRLRMIRGR